VTQIGQLMRVTAIRCMVQPSRAEDRRHSGRGGDGDATAFRLRHHPAARPHSWRTV